MTRFLCPHCRTWCDRENGHAGCQLAAARSQLNLRFLVGLVWYLAELVILAGVVSLVRSGHDHWAYALGIALIWFSYFEGRVRHK